MKKSELKQLVKEILLETKGYSKYYPGGKTPGLTSKTLNQILLNIAKSEEPYEGDPDKGNKILDTADQDNIDRITRGEEPIYEVDRMQELAGIKQENNPNILSAINNYVKTWEDEDMLKDANSHFSTIPNITVDEFFKFFENYIDDMSELKYIKKAWKDIQNNVYND